MAASTTTRKSRRLRRRDRRLARSPRHGGRTSEVGDPRIWPDDLDGGAGVREPRRPYPGSPGGALALEEPHEQRLDLVAGLRPS